MIDRNRALSALNALDPGCPRDNWLRIGMAAKSAGLEFDDFHDWSKAAANYKGEKDCRGVWKSFNENGRVTAATLFYLAAENGWKDSESPHSFASNRVEILPYPNGKTYALDIWEKCIPAPSSHDYILRKQGTPDDLRVYPANAPSLTIRGKNVAGYLVIPCWSNNQLQTLQFIPPNGGDKLNLPKASFNDGFFTIGIIEDIVYLCEGIGQAWTINKLSKAAVVCFGAGRMMSVAKVIRAKYPKCNLVIVPDRGKEKQASEIAIAISGHWTEMPNEKPSNYDVSDYLQEFGINELATLLERTKAPAMRYKLLPGSELLNAAPMRWIVRGVIPTEGLVALYGASGTGKSFLILDMGCAIAAGNAYWFGLRITQVPVTYICLEGEAGLSKRIKAWSLHHSQPLPDLLRFITQPFNLLSDDIFELAKAIAFEKGEGGLVVIDTLNRAAPGADENSSVDMGNIIAAAKKLQSVVGGLVMLVHHTGKDATKGLRGHSSLYAALDGAIEVTNINQRREWSVAKSKDDVTGCAHPFRLDVIPVGLDDEGEEITSCVAKPDISIDKTMRRVIPPKSGNQKIIWEALGPILHSSAYQEQSAAPLGKPSIKLGEAIEKTRGLLICEPKRQSERAQSAISGLVSRGLLQHKEGWLWAA